MKTLKPNHLGDFSEATLEFCEKISLKSFLKQARQIMKRTLLESLIEIMGLEINLKETKLHHGGTRLWFECPICRGRKAILFRHPLNTVIGCRQCLNLKYSKQRYKGMLENL